MCHLLDNAAQKKRQRIDNANSTASARPVRQRQSIYSQRIIETEPEEQDNDNSVFNTCNTSSQPLAIDYSKLASEIIKQQNNSAIANTSTVSTGDSNSCDEAQTAYLLPPLSSDQSVNSNINIQSTSQHVPSQQNVSVHQTAAATNSSFIQPTCTQTNNVLPNNDWQSNPLVALVNSIFSSEPTSLGNCNINQDLSLGIPLGANVSLKIKSRIWLNEYIDLKSLVSHMPDENVSLTLSQNRLLVQNLQPSKSKDPLTFSEWQSAFHIYMAIFIEKYPDQAAHMLKYMEIIKGIKIRKGDEAWRFYDDQFRRLCKTHLPAWQKPIDELYNVTMNKKYSGQQKSYNFNAQQNNNTHRQSTIFHGPKICFAFNLQRKCVNNPCPFKHACKICRGSHPQVLCTKSINNTTSPNIPKPPTNSTKSTRSGV